MANSSSIACLLLVSLLSTAITGGAAENYFLSGLKVVYRALQQCENSDMLTCLKIRVVRSLDKIIQEDEVSIFQGVSFKKVPQEKSGRGIMKPFNELDENNLPREPKKLEETVDEMLVDRLIRFFKSHTLKVSLGELKSEGRGDKGGILGGGGKKGGGGILLLGAMMAAGMSSILMGGIGLTAGTALLVAKMALVISAVIGLTKLSHRGGGESTYKVVAGHGDYDRVGRFRRDTENAQSMAYKGHLHGQ